MDVANGAHSLDKQSHGDQFDGRSSADNATRWLNPALANQEAQGLYISIALRAARIRRTDSRSGCAKAGPTNVRRPLPKCGVSATDGVRFPGQSLYQSLVDLGEAIPEFDKEAFAI